MKRAVIFGCRGVELAPEEAAFFRATRPLGFILFARNIESRPQLRALCASLRACTGDAALIFIDQEGGLVQRLRPPLGREWAPPQAFVRQYRAHAERAMYLRYRLIAAELRAVGIDANCAPLVDVAGSATHAFLRPRCYGENADEVARLGRAVAQGLLDGGVLPVLKHIPGHGRGAENSHIALPQVAAACATLEQDFAPFRALRDLPMAMTAHVLYTALDKHTPATFSPKVMGVIRNHIGFEGLIMTDDICMHALSGPMGARSHAALAAGCDVVLHCNGDLADMQAVAEAAGPPTHAAQRRAQAVLAARRPLQAIDLAALAAELDALTERAPHA